jgi:hypothetical protein
MGTVAKLGKLAKPRFNGEKAMQCHWSNLTDDLTRLKARIAAVKNCEV